MPALVWDLPEDRKYEAGLDRGVLYLPNRTGVSWNGLISVVEKFDIRPEGSFDKGGTSIYFDGMKIQDIVSLGSFTATMKAVTYPDEFIEIEGAGKFRSGVLLADQQPQVFGLSYRTGLGDDAGESTGYKLHILYNVTAIPHEKTYASESNNPSLVEFEWDIFTIPEEVSGFKPTAHVIIDSRDVDPLLLSDIEGILYGTSTADASLISMADLVTFMNAWFRIKITDNGDGTWTANIRDDAELLTWTDLPDETLFQVIGANAIYHADDATEYDLSDTLDASDIPQIKITYDPTDGSWTATSTSDILVPPSVGGEFQILDANVIFLDDVTYRISDTGIN